MHYVNNHRLPLLGLSAAVTIGLTGIVAGLAAAPPAGDQTPSRLCVVWSSSDPGVAKSVCFMYTKAAGA